MTVPPFTRAARAARSLGGEVLPLRPSPRLFSSFELWPWYIFYLPVTAHWLRLSVRHRSPTLPTIVNPLMEAGGLYGESKARILSQLGAEARRWLAPFTTADTASVSDPTGDLDRALAAMNDAGLGFPLVAKPDIGCRGTGVRVIDDAVKLSDYLSLFPRGERVVLQTLVLDEREAGVLYVRRPDERQGRIFSLTLKSFPSVVGDGRSTLRELILQNPRARRISSVYFERHADQLARVLGRGELFRLVFTGNHCKGAVFRNGNLHVTPAMTERFDGIARDIPEFYFGRFDVRFSSLAALKRGEDFTIIEVNGAGSEATHIWDRRTRLIEAYRTLFKQVEYLFEIGNLNRARGFRPAGPIDLLRLCDRQRRLMARYPLSR